MVRMVQLVTLCAAMGGTLAACGGGAPTGPTASTGQPAATASGTSIGDALTRLQADFAAGRISEAEYDLQRRAILTGAGG